VFDTLIFIMTVYKSVALHVGSRSTLLSLMLRDGSVYFGVMAAFNVANILTYLYGGVSGPTFVAIANIQVVDVFTSRSLEVLPPNS